jgi:AbrB family looped-hinge helix DNA binding protein
VEVLFVSDFSTLSSKGQLVIPKRVREQAGWKPGEQLELIWMGDRLELRKAVPAADQPQASVVRELLGKYRTGDSSSHAETEKVKDLRENLYGKLNP